MLKSKKNYSILIIFFILINCLSCYEKEKYDQFIYDDLLIILNDTLNKPIDFLKKVRARNKLTIQFMDGFENDMIKIIKDNDTVYRSNNITTNLSLDMADSFTIKNDCRKCKLIFVDRKRIIPVIYDNKYIELEVYKKSEGYIFHFNNTISTYN